MHAVFPSDISMWNPFQCMFNCYLIECTIRLCRCDRLKGLTKQNIKQCTVIATKSHLSWNRDRLILQSPSGHCWKVVRVHLLWPIQRHGFEITIERSDTFVIYSTLMWDIFWCWCWCWWNYFYKRERKWRFKSNE